MRTNSITTQTDFRQSSEYASYMKNEGWRVIALHGKSERISYIYLWNIPLTPFHIIKIPRVSADLPLEKLEKVIVEKRAILVRVDFNIEEKDTNKIFQKKLGSFGYQTSPWFTAPSKTQVIKLNLDTEDIFAEMKSKTRYNIKLAHRHGVCITFYDGIELIKKPQILDAFYQLLKDNYQRTHIDVISRDSLTKLCHAFASKCLLSVAYLGNQMIAACLFLKGGETLFYTQNGSNKIGRKQFAPTLIVWETINKAKSMKLTYFDFDGISDERFPEVTVGWQGFTKFKKQFGGIDFKCMQAYGKNPKLKISCVESLLLRINFPTKVPSIYPCQP